MNGGPTIKVSVGAKKPGIGGLKGYRALLFAWGGGPALGQGAIPEDGQTTLDMIVPAATGHHKLILLGPHGQAHTTLLDGSPLLNWHTWKTIRIDADSEHWFEFTNCPDIEATAWKPPRSKTFAVFEASDFENYNGEFHNADEVGCSTLKVRIRDHRSSPPDHVVQVRHHDSGWITRPVTSRHQSGRWWEAELHLRNSPATTYIHVWDKKAGNTIDPYLVFQLAPGVTADTMVALTRVADSNGFEVLPSRAVSSGVPPAFFGNSHTGFFPAPNEVIYSHWEDGKKGKGGHKIPARYVVHKANQKEAASIAASIWRESEAEGQKLVLSKHPKARNIRLLALSNGSFPFYEMADKGGSPGYHWLTYRWSIENGRGEQFEEHGLMADKVFMEWEL